MQAADGASLSSIKVVASPVETIEKSRRFSAEVDEQTGEYKIVGQL